MVAVVPEPVTETNAAVEPTLYSRLYRMSVETFRKLDAEGFFSNALRRVELLDGLVVEKDIVEPAHASTQRLILMWMADSVPAGWFCEKETPLQLESSMPVADVTIFRGTARDYFRRHPTSSDIGLIIEVANSTVYKDRRYKSALYAHAGMTQMWLVNLVNRTIEVGTGPVVTESRYGTITIYKEDQDIPLTLDGAVVATVRVSELLPPPEDRV